MLPMKKKMISSKTTPILEKSMITSIETNEPPPNQIHIHRRKERKFVTTDAR
jgi:hypothetical protein